MSYRPFYFGDEFPQGIILQIYQPYPLVGSFGFTKLSTFGTYNVILNWIVITPYTSIGQYSLVAYHIIQFERGTTWHIRSSDSRGTTWYIASSRGERRHIVYHIITGREAPHNTLHH